MLIKVKVHCDVLIFLQISNWHLPVKTLTGKEVRKIGKEIVHDISSDYMLRQLTVQIELEVDSENTVRIKCLQITSPLIGT